MGRRRCGRPNACSGWARHLWPRSTPVGGTNAQKAGVYASSGPVRAGPGRGRSALRKRPLRRVPLGLGRTAQALGREKWALRHHRPPPLTNARALEQEAIGGPAPSAAASTPSPTNSRLTGRFPECGLSGAVISCARRARRRATRPSDNTLARNRTGSACAGCGRIRRLLRRDSAACRLVWLPLSWSRHPQPT